MPERVEIQLMIDNINKKFSNSTLSNFTICSGRYKHHGFPLNYHKFKQNLPLIINKINCKGKFIWLTFKSNSQNWIIFITLGLTGHFETERKKHCHYIFNTNNGKFYIDDVRNFGTIQFINNNKNLEKKLLSLGPDVLTSKITDMQFINIIRKQKQDKVIGQILLDQKIISGIGNYLRSDILYVSKISPFRKLKSLSNKDIKNILKAIKNVIKNSYTQQKKKGLHQYNFLVYKRKITDKKEHVATNIVINRAIYWVPKIQH